MPFFSIITCLYNSEKLFEKGIACLLYQTFRDFEILLIDDGSSDATSGLCDNIAASHNFINVIHQENAGVGSARNVGIEMAKGEYVCFFDIDDHVERDWLEIIHERINSQKPEILIYGYREINQEYDTQAKFKFDNKLFTSNKDIKQGFAEYLSGKRFNNGFAWNKVYSREFLNKNNLRFPSAKIQQDELFNHHVYRYASVVMLVQDILYDYHIYETGNIRSKVIPERLEIFKAVKNSFLSLARDWNINDKGLDKYIYLRFIRNVFFNIDKNVDRRHRKEYLKKVISDKDVLESLSIIRREGLATDISLKLFCRLYENKSVALIMAFEKTIEFFRKSKKTIFNRKYL